MNTLASGGARVLRHGALLPAFVLACASPRSPEPGYTEASEWEHAPKPRRDAREPLAAQVSRDPERNENAERILTVLEVPGHRPALVAFPARPRRTEPLLVALHGAGDGPEWECAIWREILGDRGVVLCPTGRPLGGGHDGYYHPDHHALDALVMASLEALEKTLGDRVDTTRAVYAAYSQGATMGAHMIVPHAARFPRLILVEGGFSEWNVARGLAFRKGGGERVLFACGTSGCARRAARSAEYLAKAGLETRHEHAPGAGHTYAGAVAERVSATLDWVFEGDARWSR